ncbi:MAG: hypothetical protein KA004_08955 [Verrucomicrobiales bacterium]|nr:hypothetical protein [Verrucomicrobiales bacterium]
MPTAVLPSIADWRSMPELCRDIPWRSPPADSAMLCEAMVDGKAWQVRINEFTEEALYSLLIGGREITRFDDWPGFWKWPGQ